jgi:hypothetical protein
MLGCITDDFTGPTDLANTYLGMTKLRTENYAVKAALGVARQYLTATGFGADLSSRRFCRMLIGVGSRRRSAS